MWKPQGEAGRGVEGRVQLRLTMQGLRDRSECPGVAVAKRQPKVVLNCTVEYSTLQYSTDTEYCTQQSTERCSVPSQKPEGHSQGVSRATALHIEALGRVPPASSSSWGSSHFSACGCIPPASATVFKEPLVCVFSHVCLSFWVLAVGFRASPDDSE